MKDGTPAADLNAPKGRRKASAVVSRAQLAQTRGAFERASAGVVLVASYLGTVFTLAGGLSALLATPTRPLPWVGALVFQGLLTALQWWYGNVSRAHPVYLASLVVDTALTTLGYGPLIAPLIAVILLPYLETSAAVGAWFILAIGALAVAWYPEHVYVE